MLKTVRRDGNFIPLPIRRTSSQMARQFAKLCIITSVSFKMSPRKSNQIFEQSQEATVDFFFFFQERPYHDFCGEQHSPSEMGLTISSCRLQLNTNKAETSPESLAVNAWGSPRGSVRAAPCIPSRWSGNRGGRALPVSWWPGRIMEPTGDLWGTAERRLTAGQILRDAGGVGEHDPRWGTADGPCWGFRVFFFSYFCLIKQQ